MDKKERDCPTCADWDKDMGCSAIIHGGTQCEWKPKETKNEEANQ